MMELENHEPGATAAKGEIIHKNDSAWMLEIHQASPGYCDGVSSADLNDSKLADLGYDKSQIRFNRLRIHLPLSVTPVPNP